MREMKHSTVALLLLLLAGAVRCEDVAKVVTAATCDSSNAVGLWTADTPPPSALTQHKMPLLLTATGTETATASSPQYLALFHAGPEAELVVRIALRCVSEHCALRVSSACPSSIAPASTLTVAEDTASAGAIAAVAVSLWRWGSVIIALHDSQQATVLLNITALATTSTPPAIQGESCPTALPLIAPWNDSSVAVVMGDTGPARRSTVCGAAARQGLWLRLEPLDTGGPLVVHTCSVNALWPAMGVEVFDDNCNAPCPRKNTHVRYVKCGGHGGTAAAWTAEAGIGQQLFVSGITAMAAGRFRLSVSRGAIPDNVFCSHSIHKDVAVVPYELETSETSESSRASRYKREKLPVAFSGDGGVAAGDIPTSGGACKYGAAGLWYSVGFVSDGRRVRAGLNCSGPSSDAAAVDIYAACTSSGSASGCVRTTRLEHFVSSSSGSTTTTTTTSSQQSSADFVVQWYAPNVSTSASVFFMFVRGCDGAFTLWFDADNSSSSGTLDFISSEEPDDSGLRPEVRGSSSESSSSSGDKPWFFVNWSWVAIFGALAGVIAVVGAVSAAIAMCIAWRRARREQERDASLAGLTAVFEEDANSDGESSESARFIRLRHITPTVSRSHSHKHATPSSEVSVFVIGETDEEPASSSSITPTISSSAIV